MESVEEVKSKGDHNENDDKRKDSSNHGSAPLPSRMLDDNALNFIRNVLQPVDRTFQVIVNLVAANKVHWISCFGPLIQILEPLIMQVIGVALDASDSETGFVDVRCIVCDIRQHGNRPLNKFGAFDNRLGHILHFTVK